MFLSYIDTIPGIWSYFRVGCIAFTGMVAVTLLMNKYSPSQHDIISFEMTFSVKKMKTYLDDWFRSDQIKTVITNTWIDFFLIVCYSATLFAFCRVIALVFYNTHVADAFTVALFISFLPIIAGILDMVENIFLLYLLHKNKNGVSDGSVGEIPVFGASIAAVVKFALLMIVISFLILSIITISLIELGAILSTLLFLIIILLGIIIFMIAKVAGGK